MHTYTSTNSLFTVETQIDYITTGGSTVEYGYLGGNTVAIVQSTVAASTVFTFRYGNVKVIEYISDPSGRLVVSLKKWFQIIGAGNYGTITISAEINGTTDSLIIIPNVKKGISYYDILAPRQKQMDSFTLGLSQHSVVPPNVMLNSELIDSIIAESSLQSNGIQSPPTGTWQGFQPGYSPVTLTPGGDRANEVVISSKYTRLTYTESGLIGRTPVRIWTIDFADGCADLIVLQWTSQTGAKRRHMFPFFSLSGNVDEAASLLSLGDGFKVAKNVSNGFIVRLTGLTPYSWWYYADMAMASDLHAVPVEDGITYIDSEQTAAYCTDTQMVMPAGNRFVTFEATIKYRHYDTY